MDPRPQPAGSYFGKYAFLLPFLAFIPILPVLAQAPTPSGVPSQAPVVLRSNTRLVQLNIVVQDKKGEPVENLTKEQFTILDQNVPQEIAVFSTHSSAPRAATTSEAPSFETGVFSNRFDQTGQVPGSVTVVLFDALNTSIQDQAYARQQVVKFLRQLRPEDHVALYILTTQIITVNEFTRDSTSLLKAIERFSGYSSAQLDAATAPETEQDSVGFGAPSADRMAEQLRTFLDGGLGRLSDFANIDRALTTISAMEAIANHVARIPGRKNLIWVSGSFPISIGYDSDTILQANREQRSFQPELEHAARALDQANMAVYPVDARGLMTSSFYDASNGPSSRGFRPPTPNQLAPNPQNFYTMEELASRTGGRAFYNTNDIGGSIQRAIGDSAYTYTIGFYPKHGKWDGKFHELKVKVEEKGFSLRYRKGYFASPEPKDPAKENQENLDAAIRSPVEWTNLDLQITLLALDAKSHKLMLRIGFNTHQLQFLPKDGRQDANLRVFFGQLGQGNKTISAERQEFNLHLKPDSYDKLMQIGTSFTGALDLAPDAVSLKIIGQDETSGAIGTVNIPIKRFLAAKTAAAQAKAAQKSTKPN